MWDALITAGNLVFIPGLLAIALNKRSYIPRLSSGISLIGIATVIVGLVGAGLILSPIVVAAVGAVWVYIFLYRGEPASD
ncbi:MAG TPA: hypothetical protein VLS25_04535 [Dehalococcoidia bacterium]|nr:hypothetical protein [Dehalococcoidia bacterium]